MTPEEKAAMQDRANGKGIYDFFSKAGDDLLNSVASAADSVQSIQDKGYLDATTTKMFARSVLENLNPFDPAAATEEDLNDGELEAVRNIVSSKAKSGKSKISYGDYKKGDKLGYGVDLPDISNSDQALKLLLGQANIRRDENNNLFAIDSYDFNAPEEEKNASVFDRAAMFYDDYTTKNMSFYGAAHRFGELFGESIPVKIKVGSAEDLGISKEQLNKIPLLASESNKEEKAAMQRRANGGGLFDFGMGVGDVAKDVWGSVKNIGGVLTGEPAQQSATVNKVVDVPVQTEKEEEDSLQVAIAEFLNKSGIPNLEDLEQKTYKIQKGDTLSEIAQRNNTTVAELVDKNNITNPDLIYAGNTLIV